MIHSVNRFIFLHILHADDSPHRIALGFAIGIFVAFTPTLGLQMILVVALAWLLHANKFAGLPIVWISNPLTFAPIYSTNYLIGRLIINQPEKHIDWHLLSFAPDSWWQSIKHFWQITCDVAIPMWVGSIIVAAVTGALGYFFILFAVRIYRKYKFGHHHVPKHIIERTKRFFELHAKRKKK